MRRYSIGRVMRVAISYALFYLGLLRLWQWWVLRGKVVVLMYHRVLSAADTVRTGSHPGVVVTRESFSRQMALLKRRFVVLTLEAFTRHLAERRPFPDSSCVITFDDGWKDNFTNAWPVLRQYGLPAVIFLPVNYVGRQRLFWREALTHLLVRVVGEVRRDSRRRGPFELLLAPAGLASILDLKDADPRAAIVEAVSTSGRLTWEAANQLLSRLSGELALRPQDLVTPDGFMDWDEVRTMGQDHVVFGGHGAEHRILTELSAEGVDDELRACVAGLEPSLLGGVRAFSYPNGAWTPAIAERVRHAGFDIAFTTKAGFVSCLDDPFSVKRVNINEDGADSEPLFLSRILRLF